MNNVSRIHIPTAATLLVSIVGESLFAMEVNPAVYDPEVNNRFVSGYPTSGAASTPPVQNTSSRFIAAGYDLSAIGWNTLDTQQSVTLLSPMHYAAASHDGFKLNNSTITFLNSSGQLTTSTASTKLTLSSDASLGSFTAPIPVSAKVGYLAILDRGDQPASYIGTSLIVYGKYGKLGAATLTSATWDRANAGISDYYTYNTVGVRNGDSSSPSLAAYNGQLTLAGTHWTSNDLTGYAGGGDSPWMNPYTIAMANAVMASSGYAVRVIAVPQKTWSGAQSGDFASAGNWAENAVPNREGIAFDAGAANNRLNVNLGSVGSSVSLKGITFRPSSVASGFTLNSSGVLKLGTGGLINDSTQTQVLNSPISMYYEINFDTATPPVATGAQHWSANAGNLVINATVANNGFQLVVDGGKDTAIYGVLRGAGGLGKEGTGTLTLAQANLYTGRTTLTDGVLKVNNSTGSGTGTGPVLVWTGMLAGTGSIGGAVTVRSGGVLSPGDGDGSLPAKLILNKGAALTAGSKLAIDLKASQSDQLAIISGDVDLGGATLDLRSSDFNAASGTMFWIVNNTGTGALLNQFAGIANGASVSGSDGSLFQLFYSANFSTGLTSGGNDLVLVMAASAPVPEPLGMSLLGAGGVLLRRRRARIA